MFKYAHVYRFSLGLSCNNFLEMFTSSMFLLRALRINKFQTKQIRKRKIHTFSYHTSKFIFFIFISSYLFKENVITLDSNSRHLISRYIYLDSFVYNKRHTHPVYYNENVSNIIISTTDLVRLKITYCCSNLGET